jgi:hypothetical protein
LENKLEGNLQAWWTWLPYAEKAGRCNVNWVEGNQWGAHFHDSKKKADVKLNLCFGDNNKPLDLFVHYKNTEDKIDMFEHVTFENFEDGAPPAKIFDVPDYCKKPSSSPKRVEILRPMALAQSLWLKK